MSTKATPEKEAKSRENGTNPPVGETEIDNVSQKTASAASKAPRTDGKSTAPPEKTLPGGGDRPKESPYPEEVLGEDYDDIKEYRIPPLPVPPPWEEWSDSFINEENWRNDQYNRESFEDTFDITALLNLKTFHWVRPAEFFEGTPVVVKFESPQIDIITPNAHLCEKFEIIRYILSEISELYEYSIQNKFVECEGEGLVYVPNYAEGDRMWTPWCHIYSRCKAGVRGQRPAFNPKGLYYIRLYFMGSWRRILVDDLVPVLPSGKCALPLTSLNELWPLLLTKALLKIATIMWNESDVKRFSTISALTGWVFEWVENVDGATEDELWSDLQNTLPKYVDPRRIPSCYTLLTPSKKHFGSRKGSDSFWWLPPLNPEPPEPDDDVIFTEKEFEPLIQTENNFSVRSVVEAKRQEEIAAKKLEEEIALKKQQEEEEARRKAEEDDRKSKSMLGAKLSQHWMKVKALVKGDSHLDLRKTMSIPKDLISKISGHQIDDDTSDDRTVKTESIEEEEEDEQDEEEEEELENEEQPSTPKNVLPSTQEIIYGVEKYAGIDYKNIVKNWENICGKDSPISLIVVLNQFPPPEMENERSSPPPQIPPFLQHPIQLVEVRDTILRRDTDRPTTPLWKRFRWKAWAMKKGLIPYEEDRSQDKIRAIKAKTPFIFKGDWPETPRDDDFEEFVVIEEEFLGEDNEMNVMAPYYDSERKSEAPEVGGTPTSPSTSPPKNTTGRKTMTPRKTGTGEEEEHKRDSQVTALTQPRTSKVTNTADSKKKSTAPPTAKGSKTSQSGSAGSKRKSATASDHGKSEMGEYQTELENEEGALIIYESEIVRGESEEEMDEEYGARLSLKMRPSKVFPVSACGTVWFDCGDLARNLRKFCKFYTSQSIFGSCFILRREATIIPPSLDPSFQDIHSELPKYPNVLKEYNQNKDLYNHSIEFERRKAYHVTNYHLDNTEGIESAFYLFSDCWTEQELIVQISILQEDLLRHFTDAMMMMMKREDLPVPPPTPANGIRGSEFVHQSLPEVRPLAPPLALTIIIEPWDWRKDCCLCDPLISATVTDQWIAHVRLPAGRNTFRIWLMLKNPEGRCVSPNMNLDSINLKIDCTPFSVRLVSQTPIHVGSRNEIQNYMTNPPMLFLKQGERLANNIWGLFSCFGRRRKHYMYNLKELRRSYCPAYTFPNKINSFVRGAHDTFEELLLAIITQFNGGELDRMMLLALRVLFLNPMLGKNCMPKRKSQSFREANINFVALFLKSLRKNVRQLVPAATLTIQRYYRGWRVRRLFQMRNKNHPKFKKIEYKVRKIAMLLATETDSIFSHPEHFKLDKGEKYPKLEPGKPIDPEKVPPTILPQPPYWSLELLSHLTTRHPWLVTLYPHAHCIAHHIKIEEFEGLLPERIKPFCWYPFCREVLKVPVDAKSCFCEIDLQVYPKTGIHLKLMNNDTGKLLSQASDQIFIGRLMENRKGYTLLCYRWAFPNLLEHCSERNESKIWKIRLITPSLQDGPVFAEPNEEIYRDSIDVDELDFPKRNSIPISESIKSRKASYPEAEKLGSQIPRQLALRKFTGYYIPNRDFSLCQYVFETEEKRALLSVRFKASNENANVRIIVWDCLGKNNVYDGVSKGGAIIPLILLQPTKRKKSVIPEEEEEEMPSERGSFELENVGSLPELIDRKKKSDDSDLPKKLSGQSGVSGKQVKEEEEEEEEEEEQEQEGLDEDEENCESKPKRGSKILYRYIISIHTDEESWPLKDHEILYLLNKERKFFKEIKRAYCEEYLRQQMQMAFKENACAEEEPEEEEEEEEEEAEGQETAPPVEELSIVSAPTTLANTEKATPVNDKAERMSAPGAVTEENKTNEGIEQVIKEPPDTSTYPDPPPPTTISNELLRKKDHKEGKLKRRLNANLVMKHGGKQSQMVRRLDQPHWVLEIVTDASVKYKMKSNWQLLRKRLLQMKEPWGGEGDLKALYKELSHRLDQFLAQNRSLIVKQGQRRYSVIDPITNIFSCLCINVYNLRAMTDIELIDLLEKVWSIDLKDNEKAAEKLLLLRNPDRVSDASFLLPMESQEFDENEVEIEGECVGEHEMLGEGGEEQPGEVEMAVKRQSSVHQNASKRQSQISRTSKEAENVPLVKKKQMKITDYETPSSKQTTRGVKVVSPHSSTEPTENLESAEESPEEEEEETDLERLRKCETVQKIFDAFMEKFKDPNPIRELLVQSVEESQSEDSGFKKLHLTRSGISKYCGGRGDEELPGEGEFPSKASAVADKLLQWTMDYTCLPATDDTDDKIEDIGEFSLFFIKSVIRENPNYYFRDYFQIMEEEIGEYGEDDEILGEGDAEETVVALAEEEEEEDEEEEEVEELQEIKRGSKVSDRNSLTQKRASVAPERASVSQKKASDPDAKQPTSASKIKLSSKTKVLKSNETKPKEKRSLANAKSKKKL